MFNKYFRLMFSAVVLIAVLHITAINSFYYWELWWFDIMMHFLGGLWVAFAVFWIKAWKGLPFTLTLWRVILAVLLVGVLWEGWEFWAGLTFSEKGGYLSDMSLDVVMDFLGGVGAWLLCYKRDK